MGERVIGYVTLLHVCVLAYHVCVFAYSVGDRTRRRWDRAECATLALCAILGPYLLPIYLVDQMRRRRRARRLLSGDLPVSPARVRRATPRRFW